MQQENNTVTHLSDGDKSDYHNQLFGSGHTDRIHKDLKKLDRCLSLPLGSTLHSPTVLAITGKPNVFDSSFNSVFSSKKKFELEGVE